MSSEKTPNLGMHKWVPTDYVQRTEFNDNFAKIDDHAKQVTEQLAQTAKHVSEDLIVATSFGLIPDTNSSEAAAINTDILNTLLNTYSNVQIDGKYYVNDITVDIAGTLKLSGDFELHNFACVNHIISINGKIHHSGSMYVHGWWKHIDGIVLKGTLTGSILDKITARACRNHGIIVPTGSGANSVLVNYMRTEANGLEFLSDVTIKSITGSGINQVTEIEIITAIPSAAFKKNNITGIVINGTFHEVIDVKLSAEQKQILGVRPNLTGIVGDTLAGVRIFTGAGLYLEPNADTNWWNFTNYSGTDYTTSLWLNSGYGHNFGNLLFEYVKIGAIFGTVLPTRNCLFNHVYVEGNVEFPFLTFNGTFTVLEPLTDFKIIDFMKILTNTPKYTMIADGEVFNSVDKVHFVDVTTSLPIDLYSGQVRALDISKVSGGQIINLKRQFLRGSEIGKVATLIYHNDYGVGSWNNDVIFKAEEGYTVNETTSVTFTSVAREQYVFYAYLTGTNWYVVRVVISDIQTKSGTLTYSGDGTSTTKTIPHGIIGTPTFFQVTPSSIDSGNAGIKYVTANATNLTVTFNTAPITGTNNVKLTWKAEL